MSDQFTETSTESYGKRIRNSFSKMLFGLVFFIGAFPLIWWNEGRSVERIQTLDEGKGIVVSIAADNIDPVNNGALVHVSGTAVTDETLSDQIFGISENALKIKRIAEMYQWEEDKDTRTEENMGGSKTTKTTYSYSKAWSSKLIKSSDFKKPGGHQNPSSMPIRSNSFVASDIEVGDYKLTKQFISQINNFEPYQLSQANYDAMSDQNKNMFKLEGNEFFSGNSASPNIGDMRVRYSVLYPTEVSVIGKQSGNYIDTYKTEAGEIELLELGALTADAMFAEAESDNAMMTWLIRFGGVVLMWAGLALFLSPIRVLGAVVPILGSLLGAGIGLISGVVALVLSFATMALAWLFYRPLIGIVLAVLAFGFLFGGFKMIKKKLANRKAGDFTSPNPSVDQSTKQGWNPEDYR